MTAEQFAYWMQGFAELTGDELPTAAQWKSMCEHLKTVFVKVTPPFTSRVGETGGVRPLDWPNQTASIPNHWPPVRATCSGSLVGAGDGDTRYA